MLERLYILIEMLAITYILYELYGQVYKLDFKTIVLFFVDYGLMAAINLELLPVICNYMIYPIMILYCKYRFNSKFKVACINTVLCIILLGSLQFLCYMLLIPLCNLQIHEKIIAIFINACTLLFGYIFSKHINLFKLSYYLQKPDVFFRVVMLVGMVIIGICLYQVKFTPNGVSLENFIWMCIALSSIVLILGAMQKYKAHYFEEKSAFETYKRYEPVYNSLIEDIRFRQHDIKNHLNAIYMQHKMCSTYDELVNVQRSYCDEIAYDNRHNVLLKISDSAFAGFLYSVFIELEKAGINIESKIDCFDVETNVPIYHLIEIVGNLFTNAKEELEKMKDKRLYFALLDIENDLYIEVMNISDVVPWDVIDKMFAKGYSTKGNKRGLGLHRIKKMSKEYGFDIICSNKKYCDMNWLSFQLILKRSDVN